MLRWSATLDLFDLELGCGGPDGFFDAGSRDDAKQARAIGAHPARDGRPFGSEAHCVFAAEEHAHGPLVIVGELLCDAGDWRGELGPECTPVGEWRHRGFARPSPRRVGLEICRLGPGRLQGRGPLAVGNLERVARFERGAPTLDLARGLARLVEGVGNDPLAVDVAHRDERVVGGGVVSKTALTECHRRGDDLRRAALELGASCCGAGVDRSLGRLAADVPSLANGLPARATTEVGGERLVDLVVTRIRLLGLESGEAHDDARRAESTLARAGRRECVGPSGTFVLRQPLEGGHRPTGHATRRRHARDAGLTIDEHGATTALALWAATVLG